MKTELSKEIVKAITNIDPNLSVKDFAIAVGEVLRENYGPHNYGPFLKELKKKL